MAALEAATAREEAGLVPPRKPRSKRLSGEDAIMAALEAADDKSASVEDLHRERAELRARLAAIQGQLDKTG